MSNVMSNFNDNQPYFNSFSRLKYLDFASMLGLAKGIATVVANGDANAP